MTFIYTGTAFFVCLFFFPPFFSVAFLLLTGGKRFAVPDRCQPPAGCRRALSAVPQPLSRAAPKFVAPLASRPPCWDVTRRGVRLGALLCEAAVDICAGLSPGCDTARAGWGLRGPRVRATMR